MQLTGLYRNIPRGHKETGRVGVPFPDLSLSGLHTRQYRVAARKDTVLSKIDETCWIGMVCSLYL